MVNALSWHFLKKADFKRDLITQGKGIKKIKTSQPVLAVNRSDRSVEELLFNLPRKTIFGVKSTFPLLDSVH